MTANLARIEGAYIEPPNSASREPEETSRRDRRPSVVDRGNRQVEHRVATPRSCGQSAARFRPDRTGYCMRESGSPQSAPVSSLETLHSIIRAGDGVAGLLTDPAPRRYGATGVSFSVMHGSDPNRGLLAVPVSGLAPPIGSSSASAYQGAQQQWVIQASAGCCGTVDLCCVFSRRPASTNGDDWSDQIRNLRSPELPHYRHLAAMRSDAGLPNGEGPDVDSSWSNFP